jgi:glycosyltransferase involved in cell wall biosynthesis
LFRVFRRLRPRIVHAHMSKAGLVATVAGRLARVPHVIYHNHGMALLSSRGIEWLMLFLSEKTSCRLAHRVLTSEGVRRRAIELGICREEKIGSLMGGTINGVDALERYSPQRVSPAQRRAMREQMKLPDDVVVVGFVGRICGLKGVTELVEAWQTLKAQEPGVRLVVVGSVDERDPVPPEALRRLRDDPRVHWPGWVDNMAAVYANLDVLVLPSYHEGLPATLLEAGAMALPTVVSDIPGNADVVVDGETGLKVPVHDAPATAAALRHYVRNPDLRARHGAAARERVVRDFEQRQVWAAFHKNYTDILGRRSK